MRKLQSVVLSNAKTAGSLVEVGRRSVCSVLLVVGGWIFGAVHCWLQLACCAKMLELLRTAGRVNLVLACCSAVSSSCCSTHSAAYGHMRLPTFTEVWGAWCCGLGLVAVRAVSVAKVYRPEHRHEEGCYEKNIFAMIVCKGLSNDTSGRLGAPYFRRYGRELVSKPAISLKKSWGGHRRTTQQLVGIFAHFLAFSGITWYALLCVYVVVLLSFYCFSEVSWKLLELFI